MENEKKHLEKLAAQFVSPEDAKTFATDIQWGDDKLSSPVPVPGDDLLRVITAQIAFALIEKRAAKTRWTLYKAVAAAAIILISLFSIMTYKPNHQLNQVTMMTTSIWQSEDIISDDANLSTLSAEITEIENQLTTKIYSDTDDSSPADELESELIAINTDFWKG